VCCCELISDGSPVATVDDLQDDPLSRTSTSVLLQPDFRGFLSPSPSAGPRTESAKCGRNESEYPHTSDEQGLTLTFAEGGEVMSIFVSGLIKENSDLKRRVKALEERTDDLSSKLKHVLSIIGHAPPAANAFTGGYKTSNVHEVDTPINSISGDNVTSITKEVTTDDDDRAVDSKNEDFPSSISCSEVRINQTYANITRKLKTKENTPDSQKKLTNGMDRPDNIPTKKHWSLNGKNNRERPGRSGVINKVLTPGDSSVRPKKKEKITLVGASTGHHGVIKTANPPQKRKALFVSRLSPEIKAIDIEGYLDGIVEGLNCKCIKLKTRFDSYSSFWVDAPEDMFSKVFRTEVWPEGSIISEFFGRLKPQQILDEELGKNRASPDTNRHV